MMGLHQWEMAESEVPTNDPSAQVTPRDAMEEMLRNRPRRAPRRDQALEERFERLIEERGGPRGDDR